MNPFKVLNTGPDASKQEIIRAVALGMRQRKYSAHELARAQKLLLDPVSASVQAFVHCIDLAALKGRLAVEDPDHMDQATMPPLDRLDIFDETS